MVDSRVLRQVSVEEFGHEASHVGTDRCEAREIVKLIFTDMLF
jgi:hypothetical protein